MDVHAGLTELPEWQAFLASFQVRFRRPEGRAALARDTTGLLTEVPNQTGDTRAQAVPGTSAQRLQAFRTTMAWDEADLHRQRVQQMVDEATRGARVLVCDDTGCPTPGKASGGGRAPVFGDPGPSRPLPGGGDLLRHRAPGDRAGGGAVGPAQALGL